MYLAIWSGMTLCKLRRAKKSPPVIYRGAHGDGKKKAVSGVDRCQLKAVGVSQTP